MAKLDAERRDIDTLVGLGVDLKTATRFRKFLAGNDRRDDLEISKIVTFITPLLRAGFTLHEISTEKITGIRFF
jgi:hypothetical protein